MTYWSGQSAAPSSASLPSRTHRPPPLCPTVVTIISRAYRELRMVVSARDDLERLTREQVRGSSRRARGQKFHNQETEVYSDLQWDIYRVS